LYFDSHEKKTNPGFRNLGFALNRLLGSSKYSSCLFPDLTRWSGRHMEMKNLASQLLLGDNLGHPHP